MKNSRFYPIGWLILVSFLMLAFACQTPTEQVDESAEPDAVAVVEETLPPATAMPTPIPAEPTPEPTAEATLAPTAVPTVEPTAVPTPEPDPNAELEAALQAIVDKWAADERFPSAMLLVDSPQRALYFKGAAGVRDFESGEPISVDDAFAQASVSKTFTAAVILRLQEQGLLDIDDLIANYLPADIVNTVNVFEGVNYGPEITIRQLLNHTSGIGSTFYDGDEDGVEDFFQVRLEDPDKVWTPQEAVAWSVENIPAMAKPGEVWIYTGTGYRLLGMIAEAVSGMSLADAYRTYFFEPLGMEHSWLEMYSDPLATEPFPLAHAYSEGVDIMTLDSRSLEWGGGGIYSTLDDQDRFWRALLANNTVFANTQTVEEMQTWVEAIPGAAGYGLGLIVYHLEPLLDVEGMPSITCHAGIYNNVSLYWPETDTVIVFTLNSDTDFRSYFPFVAEVIGTLKAHGVTDS